MKRLLLSFALILSISALYAQGQGILPANYKLPGHPRILLLKNEEESIRKAVARSGDWSAMHQHILKNSDEMISLPTLERIQIGRRLLDKSRECLRRVFHLAYAYRLTGDEKYFRRAEAEMLKVSAFSDWNPSHFLDVAEMTMALAIGYDWLYDKLSPESRQTIRDAIVRKGIEPSFDKKYNWFLTATHNWNQVCNAGMAYGALAVAEDEPDLSNTVLERALETIKLPMNDYKPDGAYPEGYGYWEYGTSFNVMFLSAIEKAFGTDFGLANTPGFLRTGGFRQHMTGTTGICYNWGDCGLGADMSPSMFWFAEKTANPSLLWVERSYMKQDAEKLGRDRLFPALMVWGKDVDTEKIQAPTELTWTGQGANPVALMRTSWTDPNGIYLGFKAGSASVNHGHMDIGSFIMEWGGVRWASDFPAQDYHSLESKGIQLFGRTQDAQRWTVFRLNNRVHNTLTVNDELQRVKGYAKIDRFSPDPRFTFALSDISSVYEGQLKNFRRGVAIADQRYVVVRDELTAGDRETTVRWTMLTQASVTINDDNTVTLTKGGKQLVMKFVSGAKIVLKTWSTEPPTDYDAPNPGTTLVGFEAVLPAGAKKAFTVFLAPADQLGKVQTKVKALDKWR